jgi:DNA polymerase-3 subunit gamma/tau
VTIKIETFGAENGSVNGNNGRSQANNINDIKREAMNHPLLQKVLDEFSGAQLVEIKTRIDKSR